MTASVPADISAPAKTVTRQPDPAEGSTRLNGRAADIAAAAGPGGDLHVRVELAPDPPGRLVVNPTKTTDDTAPRLTTENGAHRTIDPTATSPAPAANARPVVDDLVALSPAMMPSATLAVSAEAASAPPPTASSEAPAVEANGSASSADAPATPARATARTVKAEPSQAVDPARPAKLAPEAPAIAPTATAPQPHRAAPATTAITTDSSAPADAVTRQLDLAQGSAWLDRLSSDIAASAGTGGDRHLRFELAPARLGKLVVDLADSADGATLRLTAETGEAHRILSEARPQLVAEARAQGVRIADAQVDLGPTRHASGQAQGQTAGQPGGQGGDGTSRRFTDPRPAPAAPRTARVALAPHDERQAATASELFA